jgi:hypothetical protein
VLLNPLLYLLPPQVLDPAAQRPAVRRLAVRPPRPASRGSSRVQIWHVYFEWLECPFDCFGRAARGFEFSFISVKKWVTNQSKNQSNSFDWFWLIWLKQ